MVKPVQTAPFVLPLFEISLGVVWIMFFFLNKEREKEI